MNHALLVGINAYPRFPLRGCINDILDVSALLKSSYGFSPDEIETLTDAAATVGAITAALRNMVDRAKPGDRMLFHYSGHGTQMVQDGAVVDAICPVDCDFTSSDNLTAPKLEAILSATPAEATLTCVADSCYSGGLAAIKAGGRLWRYFPPPPAVQAQIAALLASPRPIRLRFGEIIPMSVALLAGCGPNEGADDAEITGRYNGAFTYMLLRELAAQPDAALTEQCDAVAVQLRKNGYMQTPVLKGSSVLAGKPFLAA
jgi:hypothetical protein